MFDMGWIVCLYQSSCGISFPLLGLLYFWGIFCVRYANVRHLIRSTFSISALCLDGFDLAGLLQAVRFSPVECILSLLNLFLGAFR